MKKYIALFIMITLFSQPSSVYGASVVRTDKDIYNQGEPIRVYFTNAPGNDSDWMCIVPVGYPDTDAGDYKYMPGGLSQGFLLFDPRSPGVYEVRAYYNYRRNGYVVSDRYAFSVASDPSQKEPLAQYVEPIEPSYSLEANLPPPIPFSVSPNVIVLPGTDVYAIPYLEAEIYFQGGWWWRPWGGYWYRSQYYDHGWAYYHDSPAWYGTIPHDWRNNYINHIWNGRPWNPPYIKYGNLNNHWRGGYWRSNPGLGRSTPSRPLGGATQYGGGRSGGGTGTPTLQRGGNPSGGTGGAALYGGSRSGGSGRGTGSPTMQKGGNPGDTPGRITPNNGSGRGSRDGGGTGSSNLYRVSNPGSGRGTGSPTMQKGGNPVDSPGRITPNNGSGRGSRDGGGTGSSNLYSVGNPGPGTGTPTLQKGGNPGGSPVGRNLQGGVVRSGQTHSSGQMNRSYGGDSNRGGRR